MSIYTRFGSEVTPVTKMDEQGWIKVKRDDGSIKEYHVSDLKADGGLSEIENYVIQSDCHRCNGQGHLGIRIAVDDYTSCPECGGTGDLTLTDKEQFDLVQMWGQLAPDEPNGYDARIDEAIWEMENVYHIDNFWSETREKTYGQQIHEGWEDRRRSW